MLSAHTPPPTAFLSTAFICVFDAELKYLINFCSFNWFPINNHFVVQVIRFSFLLLFVVLCSAVSVVTQLIDPLVSVEVRIGNILRWRWNVEDLGAWGWWWFFYWRYSSPPAWQTGRLRFREVNWGREWFDVSLLPGHDATDTFRRWKINSISHVSVTYYAQK